MQTGKTLEEKERLEADTIGCIRLWRAVIFRNLDRDFPDNIDFYDYSNECFRIICELACVDSEKLSKHIRERAFQGRNLSPALRLMCVWGEENIRDMVKEELHGEPSRYASVLARL